MATLLNAEQIKYQIDVNEMIQNADEKCIEGIKYDFRLGTKFLKAHFNRSVDFNSLNAQEKSYALIQPGETVYVLTAERLKLPSNIFVRLSQKRKLSHEGIQLWGGLTIDPGYEGKLIFGLCNLSSTSFILEPGRKLVGATFEQLSEEELVNYQPPEALDDFPSEVINIIKQYKPIETQYLLDELTKCRNEMSEIRKAVDNDQQWRNDFKTSINDVKNSLILEVESRKQSENMLTESDKKLSDAVEKIQASVISTQSWMKAISVFIALSAIAVTVIAFIFR